MHKEADIQVMDFIILGDNRSEYHVYVFSMNESMMHVKSDLDQLGTSTVPRPANLKFNYSAMVRELESL